MAIVFSILKWKLYLLGRKFLMRTDQRSLKHLFEQREVNGDYQKWVMNLMGFGFIIQYNPGRTNVIANALSHIPHHVLELGALLSSNDNNWGCCRRK